MKKSFVLKLTLILGIIGCTEIYGGEISTPEPLSTESALDPSAHWYKVRLGNWECAVPETNPDEKLLCYKGKRIVVLASDDLDGFGVSVPLNKKNGAAFLALHDKNNDGIYESLTYDGTSGEENIQSVTDENMDGDIDQIIDFKKNISVRIDGKWIELNSSGRDDSGLVIHKGLVNGIEKRVFLNSYPYQVTDLPAQANIKIQPK